VHVEIFQGGAMGRDQSISQAASAKTLSQNEQFREEYTIHALFKRYIVTEIENRKKEKNKAIFSHLETFFEGKILFCCQFHC